MHAMLARTPMPRMKIMVYLERVGISRWRTIRNGMTEQARSERMAIKEKA